MLVPHNSPELVFATQAKPGTSAFPFVVATTLAGIKVVPQIANACISVFVFSGANSELYLASRTLYGVASDGSAHAIFKVTDKRGVPVYALGASSPFMLLAFMNVSGDSTKIFTHLVNLITMLSLLTWISILVTHIFWCRGRKAQGIVNEQLPYLAPFGIWGSHSALFLCILISLTNNYDVFTGWKEEPFRDKTYKVFITGYLGLPILLALVLVTKLSQKVRGCIRWMRTFLPAKLSLTVRRDTLASQAKGIKENGASKRAWFYEKFVSYLV